MGVTEWVQGEEEGRGERGVRSFLPRLEALLGCSYNTHSQLPKPVAIYRSIQLSPLLSISPSWSLALSSLSLQLSFITLVFSLSCLSLSPSFILSLALSLSPFIFWFSVLCSWINQTSKRAQWREREIWWGEKHGQKERMKNHFAVVRVKSYHIKQLLFSKGLAWHAYVCLIISHFIWLSSSLLHHTCLKTMSTFSNSSHS